MRLFSSVLLWTVFRCISVLFNLPINQNLAKRLAQICYRRCNCLNNDLTFPLAALSNLDEETAEAFLRSQLVERLRKVQFSGDLLNAFISGSGFQSPPGLREMARGKAKVDYQLSKRALDF